MAKRYTSTEKWSDPWYRKLSPKHKCLWDWLFTQCDIAGTIEPDFELASFQIGEVVTIDDMRVFDGRVELLECGRHWLIKFIPFQYGLLSDKCLAHIAVLKLVESLGIPLSKGMRRLKDKDKEKDIDKDKDKDKEKDSIGWPGGSGGLRVPAETEIAKIDGQPIIYGFWDTVVASCGGSRYDAAVVIYRAKAAAAKKITAWIIAGFRDGYVHNACKAEDEAPATVKAWVEKWLNKIDEVENGGKD